MDAIIQFITEEALSHSVTLGAGMLIIWLPRLLRRRQLKKPVEKAYRKLRRVCEPNTMNPADPGNQSFMRSEARDEVNLLVRPLEKVGFYGPAEECSTEEASLHLCSVTLERCG